MTALGAVVGLSASPGLAGAREISPDQAPAAWVAYAMSVSQTVTAWLNAETPPAPRVRAVLEATRAAPDQPTPPVVLKLWIDGQGNISRADCPSLGDATADADLQTLLVGHRLAPPPRHMLLPIRIALQLPPRPPGPGSAA